MQFHKFGLILTTAFILVIASGFYFPFQYKSSMPANAITPINLPLPFVVTHLKTPDVVKAIYMSSWVAGNEKLRNNLVNLISSSELNAVVIDVKDYTGRISFLTENLELNKVGSPENRIPDVKEFIGSLHDKGIYVIGRISSFQDSFFVKNNPQYAVKTKAGAVWKDDKGVSWLDAGAKPVWDYLASIGDEAHSVGFDELNFDYIRFPSDGNMQDIAYPFSQGKIKANVVNDFFTFIDNKFHGEGIPISADLFGMTTSDIGDLGIGQVLENALKHFDFVAPMVYPSHYPPNFNGWKNPSEKPYDLVLYAMSKAVVRANTATTSPYKLRPWLQDFSINGTTYTSDMIRAQIKATYDAGLTSWMLWNASNVYTVSALDLKKKQ